MNGIHVSDEGNMSCDNDENTIALARETVGRHWLTLVGHSRGSHCERKKTDCVDFDRDI